MTPVFGLSEVRAKAHLRPFICRAACVGNDAGGADDNSPDAQERSEWKAFTLRSVAEAGAATPRRL